MIPRTPTTHEILSDMSYGGMGFWSPQFQILWHILRPDLIEYGFSMKTINSASEPSDLYNPEGVHINPLLEFVGVFIDLFISIKMLLRLDTPPSGFIVELIADNTSALAWLKYAATTENQSVRLTVHLASSVSANACIRKRIGAMLSPCCTPMVYGINHFSFPICRVTLTEE
jgi:hypothetical protein